MTHRFLPLLLLAAALASCKGGDGGHDDWSEARTRMEERGAGILNDARRALRQRDFSAAREHIKTLRSECDLALTAREAGILLLDSIDISEAYHELKSLRSRAEANPAGADSLNAAIEECAMKLKFYRRKLQHDRDAAAGTGGKQGRTEQPSSED